MVTRGRLASLPNHPERLRHHTPDGTEDVRRQNVTSTLRASISTPRPLNHLATQLRDLAERILLGHAGPLDAEDEVIHSERAGVPLDVVLGTPPRSRR